ncbi:hypothetical protein [Burkholderia gladioli]|uniref:hypothetical protein n=1 Tax=Burkholderia gladioli TaxID=28095 RepID=UPI001641B5C4|nr:hypothetical protein [Burkholderia gladioli]
MQILKTIEGKLTLAHVTPVIRAVFAPFGVQDDGTLSPKDMNPMWLDLIPFLRTLMDTMGVDHPAEATSAAMLNTIARHMGKPDAVSDDDQDGDGDGDDRDGENYLLTEAFDLAVALDDGHGLIEATAFLLDHGIGYGEGLDATTCLVTRHVDFFDRTIHGYEHAAAVHDALRRKDYGAAAALIEGQIDDLLMEIRDPNVRRKVAARITVPQR